jgi:hypothetical protein
MPSVSYTITYRCGHRVTCIRSGELTALRGERAQLTRDAETRRCPDCRTQMEQSAAGTHRWDERYAD